MSMLRLLVVIVAFALTSCDQRSTIDAMTPKAEDAFAKHVIELMQAGDIEAVEATFAEGVLTDQQKQQLPAIASSLPHDRPIEVVTEGVNFQRTASQVTTQLIYQYQFTDKWFLISVGLIQKADAPLRVYGLDLRPLPGSLREINAFRLSGKPVGAYLMAVATIAIIAFMIVTALVCLLSPMPRWYWKPLWLLAMPAGMGQLIYEWTSGQTSLVLENFNWLSASIGRMGPDGSYFFEAVLPVGALTYWIWRTTIRPSGPEAGHAARFD